VPSPDTRLILFTFPQRWEAGFLSVRVLALPRGNPLTALPGTGTPFATAQLKFDAVLIPGTEKLPDPGLASHRVELAEAPRPYREAIFNALATTFEIKPVPVAPAMLPGGTAFRKYLTRTYREACAFRGPRTPFVVTDETYACAVKDATPAERATPPSPEVSWGQLYSFLLRQPRLAEAAGLVQAATVEMAGE
jgi:hypothetical protein